MRRSLVSLGACALAVVLGAAPAVAKNVQTLDTEPTSPGTVVEDAGGTAYVAWAHNGHTVADSARFCRIPAGGTCTAPIALPIPAPADSTDGVSGAFPVFVGASTIDVVAPRYVQDDVLVYTSTDGGQTFGAVQDISTGHNTAAGAYSNKTNPTNVLRSGSEFLIGAYNSGLGFSAFPSPQGNFTFPNTNDAADSSMGLDSAGNPVIAYFNLTSPQTTLSFYRYGGSGPITLAANWSASPGLVGYGDEPRLAGGASGLFLAADEYATGASQAPTVLTVRKYSAGSFGAPLSLGDDPSTDLYDGGAIAQSPSGHVAVAWPTARAGDNLRVMRLYTSTDGGASFPARSDVAQIGAGYAVEDNAHLATLDDGTGWLTFRDAGGLELADLSAISPYTPKPPPSPTPTTPGPYAGANRTIAAAVGGGVSITLKLPKACVLAHQPFNVYVGTKLKHRIAHTVHAAVTKVTFSVDGVKLKTVRHKPFKVLIATVAGTAKSPHSVTAKVTVRVRRGRHVKTVTKTVKGKTTIC